MDHRPRLSTVVPVPSPDEAAAVVAALERFLQDTTAPPPVELTPRRSPWLEASLQEGVTRAPATAAPWA